MKTVKIECSFCKEKFDLYVAEHKRQLKRGRKDFFCGRSCAALHNNSKRPNRVQAITKICPQCETVFETQTGKLEKTFCSRSCASKGSMSEYRRQRQREGGRNSVHTAASIAALLKVREAWRYSLLKDFLEKEGIPLMDQITRIHGSRKSTPKSRSLQKIWVGRFTGLK